MSKKKKKNIKHKLIYHYRWLIVDEDTNESKVSFRLNILNFLLLFSLFLTTCFFAIFLLLKYTPVKEYFLNSSGVNSSIAEHRELLKLNDEMMALEDSLKKNELYLTAISNVISGKFKAAEVDSLLAKQTPVLLDDKKLKASEKDSIFRIEIAKEELEGLKKVTTKENQLLFPPVRGIVTSSYDVKTGHLATDIAASKGDDVKTIADGKIVLIDWSPDTGNIIMVQHDNDMISIYKHCSQVFKKVGDEVGRGDVIASVGNGGELTTGPHLHFELWIKGNAVNPEEYIDF